MTGMSKEAKCFSSRNSLNAAKANETSKKHCFNEIEIRDWDSSSYVEEGCT
jgi:hypothetical protein